MDARRKRLSWWSARLFGLAAGVAHALLWLYGFAVAAAVLEFALGLLVKRRW